MSTPWLHLTALVIYLGSLAGLWLVALPRLSRIKDHEGQVEFLVRCLKVYNPVQTGALGVLVLSGAFQLTDLKAAYRDSFIQQFGATLEWKLALSFVLIVFSTYQTMGVGHRFVRRYEVGERPSIHEMRSVVRRLKILTLCIVSLALVTVWFGMKMAG
jgi:hypothetical protein